MRIIVNEIEIVLNKFSDDLQANSIQLYNNPDDSVSIEISIYFKDFIEEININTNITLN